MFKKLILYIIKNLKNEKSILLATKYLRNRDNFKYRNYDVQLEKIVRESKSNNIQISALSSIRNQNILASFIRDGIFETRALKNIDSLKTLKELYYDDKLKETDIHYDIKWKYVDLLKIYLNGINNTAEQIRIWQQELEKIIGKSSNVSHKSELTRSEIESNMDEGWYSL